MSTPTEHTIDIRTDLQRWIHNYAIVHQYAPSIREISAYLGMTSSSAWEHLHQMRIAGMVDWLDGQPRTIHARRRP